jgi:hypothetical protein
MDDELTSAAQQMIATDIDLGRRTLVSKIIETFGGIDGISQKLLNLFNNYDTPAAAKAKILDIAVSGIMDLDANTEKPIPEDELLAIHKDLTEKLNQRGMLPT